jgi:hypothetical protein
MNRIIIIKRGDGMDDAKEVKTPMNDTWDDIGNGPTTTITYRGARGPIKITQCRAVVSINESVVCYFSDKMILIPWARVISIEQSITEKIKKELETSFQELKSQAEGPPKDVSVG